MRGDGIPLNHDKPVNVLPPHAACVTSEPKAVAALGNMPVLRRHGGETTGSTRQIQDRRAAGRPRGGRHIDE